MVGQTQQQVVHTPSSGASSTVTVAADVHRALQEEDDDEYDEVVQVEEGNDGEDLDEVAAGGKFQPIHLRGGVGFN